MSSFSCRRFSKTRRYEWFFASTSWLTYECQSSSWHGSLSRPTHITSSTKRAQFKNDTLPVSEIYLLPYSIRKGTRCSPQWHSLPLRCLPHKCRLSATCPQWGYFKLDVANQEAGKNRESVPVATDGKVFVYCAQSYNCYSRKGSNIGSIWRLVCHGHWSLGKQLKMYG